MMKWDSRMHNTRSVQVLKVAIPFFDVSEGELIDVEGLLQAIHPLTCGRERKMMDSVMSFFQMRHMMDLFRMMREVQKANEASFLRNHEEWGDKIIYFGPMGCRTGFYLLLAGDYESEDIISLLREMFEFVCHFEGEIPGAAPEACGNYLDQNLPMAKYLAEKYLEHVLTGITPDRLKY